MSNRNDTNEQRLERMAGGILRRRYDRGALLVALDRAGADAAEHRRIDLAHEARQLQDQHEQGERWDGQF